MNATDASVVSQIEKTASYCVSRKRLALHATKRRPPGAQIRRRERFLSRPRQLSPRLFRRLAARTFRHCQSDTQRRERFRLLGTQVAFATRNKRPKDDVAYNARALISKRQSSHCQLAARATPQSSFGQLAFNVPFGLIAFCVQAYRNDNASWPFFDSGVARV